MKSKVIHEEFIGKKIGVVEIVRFVKSVEKKDRFWHYYEYKCVCGEIGVATKHTLLNSVKRNLYCCLTCRKNRISEWSKKHSLKFDNPIDAATSRLFSEYRGRAKKKNWKFLLTFDEFQNLIFQNCHYCNLAPNKFRKNVCKVDIGISKIYFNGIDRVDSNLGYVLENCLTCCEDCNKAKRNLNYLQFLNLVESIYFHRIKDKNISTLPIFGNVSDEEKQTILIKYIRN